MADMEQLEVINLYKSYDGKNQILRDVSLTVKRGEFVVLVGPSGCGKSTLLRSIAGLEDVTAGQIKIAGRVVNNLAPAERDIAMVFQDYALYPHMSVEKNLAFGLKMRKVPADKIKQEIGVAAKMLDIEHLLHRKPAQLSGGQRQRVAIGRAIVRHASLFLFDEPLSNLDAQLRAQTRIELAALHEKVGATSIYVTHDQVEAMTLADRIVVLNLGIVQQVGSPMELYERPANKFVASFIGSPSMNFFDGELVIDGGRKQFIVGTEKLDFSSAPTPDKPGKYTLGLRPESLKVIPHEEARDTRESVDMKVTVVMREPHGHEVHVVGKWADSQLLFRSANPARVRTITQTRKGDQLSVTIDRTSMHWFEQGENSCRVNAQ
jgi:ABC-type sugar transport system ATPase subunit